MQEDIQRLQQMVIKSKDINKAKWLPELMEYNALMSNAVQGYEDALWGGKS
jgi:hypothetical protein